MSDGVATTMVPIWVDGLKEWVEMPVREIARDVMVPLGAWHKDGYVYRYLEHEDRAWRPGLTEESYTVQEARASYLRNGETVRSLDGLPAYLRQSLLESTAAMRDGLRVVDGVLHHRCLGPMLGLHVVRGEARARPMDFTWPEGMRDGHFGALSMVVGCSRPGECRSALERFLPRVQIEEVERRTVAGIGVGDRLAPMGAEMAVWSFLAERTKVFAGRQKEGTIEAVVVARDMMERRWADLNVEWTGVVMPPARVDMARRLYIHGERDPSALLSGIRTILELLSNDESSGVGLLRLAEDRLALEMDRRVQASFGELSGFAI